MLRKNTGRYATLIILSLLWMLPLIAMIVFSFAPNSDILQMRLLPSELTFSNYTQALGESIRGVSIPRSLVNSTLIALIQVTLILLLDAPAAYALARCKFPGRGVIFACILLTMMMPAHIILISLYELMSNLGLIDTLPGVFLPGLPRVIGIFLLRQFFQTLPDEIEEAARIDGAGQWQTFVRVMLPMAGPALASLIVITLLYSWNNFLWPLIAINSPDTMTVPIAVAYLQSGTNPSQNYATLLAAAFITSLPMILFFLVAQRRITEGISPTAGTKL